MDIVRSGFALSDRPGQTHLNIDLRKRTFPNDLVTLQQIIEKIVHFIPNVEHLYLDNVNVKNLFNYLSCLKNLKSLILHDDSGDGSICPALKGLKFPGVRIYSPEHLEPISFLKLQSLSIIISPNLREILSVFKNATNLRELSIARVGPMKWDFERILLFKNLNVFKMRYSGECFNYEDSLMLTTHSTLENVDWIRVPYHPKPSDYNRNLPDNTAKNNQIMMDEFKKRNPKLTDKSIT